MSTLVSENDEGNNAENKQTFVEDFTPVFHQKITSQYDVPENDQIAAARAMAEFIWNRHVADRIQDPARKHIVQANLRTHCGDMVWEALREGVSPEEFPGGIINPILVTNALLREAGEVYNQWLDERGLGNDGPSM